MTKPDDRDRGDDGGTGRHDPEEDGVGVAENFSSTMRIEIPPDLEDNAQERLAKPDTSRIRFRPPTQRVARIHPPDTPASKYSQLLQSIYDAALITDLDGHIVDSNVRAAEFLGYTSDEFQNLPILDMISGASTSLLETLRQNTQDEKFALLQAYCLRKDRSLFPAEIAVNMLKFEETRLCFFIRDVTLRRQAEALLRTEHNAIQNSASGIAIVDADAKLEYVNLSFVKLWGLETEDQVVGLDIRSLLSDSPNMNEMVRAALVEHGSWNGELTGRREDGSIFSAQVSAACNRDSDGEVVGMVMSFVDISDRKRTEEALRQAEQHRVMLASVGAACHHLGQPATVILTNLELIKRMTRDTNRKDLQDILRSTNQAAEQMAAVLHKLNAVDEYRTVQYLDTRSATSPDNVILDI
jgi:PAS domain S-box-containing protein